ncbi:alpha/beta hydrolase [Geodermatophilus sabuli]|uniref:alpha/beta hydrolase n=1 Tax=Geodermatophilus sabuli TaxID=1564158 RepID=UPI0016204EF8|nr:alpha/beta hydrolase [Geodermatophilus sabuli]MBB3084632.1 pimeloyl-ACP methyl ester carboxylesterase [Geodermatophilus sabuli]
MAGAVTLVGGGASVTVASADTTPQPEVGAGAYDGVLDNGATWVAHVPQRWNGTVVLFAHGFGPLRAQDAPNEETRQALLDRGYALVGSSYSGPSLWALETAVDDQFGALAAFEDLLGVEPERTIAFGRSMGGLVSARQAEDPRGEIDGVLTTCGIVAGALNLNNYQLDGVYTLSHLLGVDVPLVRYESAEQAQQAADALIAAVTAAQGTAEGRARIALASAYLDLATWYSGDAPAPQDDHAAQQVQQYQALIDGGGLERYVTGRQQIELAAGGNSASNVGVDYRELLESSPHAEQVWGLYQDAGLDLEADLATLTRDADVEADPEAIADLTRSSMVTGDLEVPELAIHTVADELVPVEHEDWYEELVHRAGEDRQLRQAYVQGTGHCEFQPAEQVAALQALEQRLDTGRWHGVAEPERLNAAADTLQLGTTARFTEFDPPRLVGGLGEPGREHRR